MSQALPTLVEMQITEMVRVIERDGPEVSAGSTGSAGTCPAAASKY